LCDLTQSLGKQDVTEVFEYCDLGVFSGHKFYGPKGSGVLYIQRHVQKRIAPIFSGGGQERGLRGGTQHASNAHGLFMSMSKALQEMPTNLSHFEMLTSHFRSQLILSGVNFIEIGERAARLPNTLNVRFVGFDADELLANIPEVEVSTGSACNSAVQEPSHVLLAHGLSVSEANECVRFSFGTSTALHEIDFAARSIQFALGRLRDIKMVG
jgi:cysteine desulfurase